MPDLNALLGGAPYASLKKLDAEGTLVRLRSSEYVSILALKHNPLVTPEVADTIMPHATDWQDDYDRLVVDLVDIAYKIDTGMLDTMDLSDESDLLTANELMMIMMMHPGLLPSMNPSSMVGTSEPVITSNIWTASNLIGQEYVMAERLEEAAKIEERMGKNNPDAPLEAARVVIANMSASFTWSYSRQLDEAAEILPDVLARMEVTEDDRSLWIGKWRDASVTDMPGATVAVVRQMMDELTFEQQQALLRTTHTIRTETLTETSDLYPQLWDIRNKPVAPTGE